MTSSKDTTNSSVSLKLLLLIAILFIFAVVVVVLIFFLCFRRTCKKRKLPVKHSSGTIPLVSKEIKVVKAALDLTPATTMSEVGDDDVDGDPKKEAEIKGDDEVTVSVEDPDIGWGRWYSIREVEIATRGFAQGNVIGEGGYGVVYRGLLQDGSVVAVKNLLNNKYVTSSNFFFYYLIILYLNFTCSYLFYAYFVAFRV